MEIIFFRINARIHVIVLTIIKEKRQMKFDHTTFYKRMKMEGGRLKKNKDKFYSHFLLTSKENKCIIVLIK